MAIVFIMSYMNSNVISLESHALLDEMSLWGAYSSNTNVPLLLTGDVVGRTKCAKKHSPTKRWSSKYFKSVTRTVFECFTRFLDVPWCTVTLTLLYKKGSFIQRVFKRATG